MENNTLTIDEVHRYFVQEYIPILCVLSLVGVTGTLGNILTIVFYNNARACSTNTLIITLAWVDLFVCITSFGLVAEIYRNVLITYRIFCSLLHVLIVWTTYSSILTLWVISIDRYSKLCRPMKRQLSIKKAKIVTAVCICFAAVLSSRTGLTQKIVNVSVTIPGQEWSGTVEGHSCSKSPDQNLSIIVWVFFIIEAVCGTGVCLTLVITYSRIICALIGHHRELSDVLTHSPGYEQTHRNKPSFKNKRKLSDTISEKVSEFPTTSLNVSDIEVHTLPESKRTTDDEYSANKGHTIVENEKGGFDEHKKESRPSGTPETNGSVTCMIKGTIDNVDECVTGEKTVEDKIIQEQDAVVSLETDAVSNNKTSTNTLDSSVDKMNNMQNSQVQANPPETVDEEIPDSKVSSKNKPQRSTSYKNTNETKRGNTRANDIKRSERRVTFQMLAASIGFMCFFLPYMVMRLTRSLWQDFDENDFSVENWIPFLLPIGNSVLNPILYSVMNQRYRSFIKGCVRKILFCGICKPSN